MCALCYGGTSAIVEDASESLEEHRPVETELSRLLEALPDRERQILLLHFGLDGESGMKYNGSADLIGGMYHAMYVGNARVGACTLSMR